MSLALAKAGSHVITVAKTQGALEELDDAIQKIGGTSTVVPMDLTQFDGIDQLGAAIYETLGEIGWPFCQCRAFWAKWRPYRILTRKNSKKQLPLMLLRIIALSVLWTHFCKRQTLAAPYLCLLKRTVSRKAFWGVYAASKSALDALVMCYAQENQKSNVRINLVTPGPIRTQMRAKAMPGEDPDTLPNPSDVTEFIIPLLSPQCTTHGEIIDLRDKVKRG